MEIQVYEQFKHFFNFISLSFYQMGNSESQQVQEQTPQQIPGNNVPATQNHPQPHYDEDQQFFVTSDLSKVKLSGSANDIVYLWIDPRIYNDQNSKNLKLFKEKLPHIEEFSSLGSLQNQLSQIDTNSVIIVISAASLPDQNYKAMNSQRRISDIVLFCQNQQRAKLLMSNFPKIHTVGYTSVQVLQKITELQAKRPNQSLIKNSMLFMTEDDASIMNKYRLNYYCLTSQKNKQKAMTDFVNLALKLYPQQSSQIQNFKQNYKFTFSNEEQKYQQTMSWMFRQAFYWQCVNNLPKVTTDPRKLAYLRLPVKDIYQTILHKYRTSQNIPEILYIVVELTTNQKQKLLENQQNFLIFTTFVKAYTNVKKANQEFKRLGENAWIFDVLLARKLHKELDFGYVINDQVDKSKNPNGKSGQPNVIFNLYNFFKIIQVTPDSRRVTIEYGSLAQAFKLRLDPQARSKLIPSQKNLLRNYDYLEQLMKKIRNQGNVLQLSGYYKQSIEIYNKKLQEITRTNKPAVMLDEYKIQKGDALKMSEQYDLAQKQYRSVQTEKLKLIAKVRLIELYWLRRMETQAQNAIEQLQQNVQALKSFGFMEDYFRAKNYIGLNMLKKDKNRESNKYYKSLRGEVSDYYDYKMEGIPLAHEIYRNLALSETKLNNVSEALNLLNSTRVWLRSSQGKGMGAILTQKLIQNVYESSGDKQGAEETQKQIKNLIQQSSIDVNIDASMGAIKVQQSIQQSLVNIDLDNSAIGSKKQQEKKRTLIQQSAVNIDF